MFTVPFDRIRDLMGYHKKAGDFPSAFLCAGSLKNGTSLTLPKCREPIAMFFLISVTLVPAF
jgi:hypothetical protein